jgi:hypothetical protein
MPITTASTRRPVTRSVFWQRNWLHDIIRSNRRIRRSGGNPLSGLASFTLPPGTEYFAKAHPTDITPSRESISCWRTRGR